MDHRILFFRYFCVKSAFLFKLNNLILLNILCIQRVSYLYEIRYIEHSNKTAKNAIKRHLFYAITID